MSELEENQRLVKQARELFDDSVESLDATTLSRLNRGRHAALAELVNASKARRWVRWVPATGVVAAALVTIVVMRGPDGVDITVAPVSATDFEMLLEDQNLEMLEDLDFYSWLEPSDLAVDGNVG